MHFLKEFLNLFSFSKEQLLKAKAVILPPTNLDPAMKSRGREMALEPS